MLLSDLYAATLHADRLLNVCALYCRLAAQSWKGSSVGVAVLYIWSTCNPSYKHLVPHPNGTLVCHHGRISSSPQALHPHLHYMTCSSLLISAGSACRVATTGRLRITMMYPGAVSVSPLTSATPLCQNVTTMAFHGHVWVMLRPHM